MGTPTKVQVAAGLKFIDTLDRTQQNAFLGLFAGARFPWTIYDDGRAPFIGKAECEWVKDWRGFYSERLPAAGLFYWEEGESGPALGMVKKLDGEHHIWTRIDCGPTRLGYEVREAWWERWRKQIPAESGLSDLAAKPTTSARSTDDPVLLHPNLEENTGIRPGTSSLTPVDGER